MKLPFLCHLSQPFNVEEPAMVMRLDHSSQIQETNHDEEDYAEEWC